MSIRYVLYTYAPVVPLLAGVRLFPGVGDARGDDPGPERLQVHRHERLQRRHHLHRGRRRRRHHRERPQLSLPHPLHLHHLLHHSHAVSRLRAEGRCHCRARWRSGYGVRVIVSLSFSQTMDGALCRAFKDQREFVSPLQGTHLPPMWGILLPLA